MCQYETNQQGSRLTVPKLWLMQDAGPLPINSDRMYSPLMALSPIALSGISRNIFSQTQDVKPYWPPISKEVRYKAYVDISLVNDASATHGDRSYCSEERMNEMRTGHHGDHAR
jgi:hypothetical protein